MKKPFIFGAGLLALIAYNAIAPNAAPKAQTNAESKTEQKAQIGDTISLNDLALGCPTSGHVTGFGYFAASNKYGEKSIYDLADEWNANNSKTCAHFRHDHESGVIENIKRDSYRDAFCIGLQGWPKCLWFQREDFIVLANAPPKAEPAKVAENGPPADSMALRVGDTVKLRRHVLGCPNLDVRRALEKSIVFSALWGDDDEYQHVSSYAKENCPSLDENTTGWGKIIEKAGIGDFDVDNPLPPVACVKFIDRPECLWTRLVELKPLPPK